MKPKQLKESIALIRKAYSALYAIPHRDCVFEKVEASERRHRKWRPSSLRGDKWPVSVKDASRLFTVLYIAQALEGMRYAVSDILSIRNEVLYAQAMVELYEDTIREAWKSISITDILALDYAEMMCVT